MLQVGNSITIFDVGLSEIIVTVPGIGFDLFVFGNIEIELLHFLPQHFIAFLALHHLYAMEFVYTCFLE